MEYLESAIAMSPSQSGVYQSKVVTNAVRQTKRWLDWGTTALRRAKVKAFWTVQTLLYPVYVVFQTVRLAGAQMREAIELEAFSGDAGAIATPASTPRATPTLTADTPIQNALLTVQQFCLSTDLAVAQEQANHSVPKRDQLVPASPSIAVLAARAISKTAVTLFKWGKRISTNLVQSRPINRFQANRFQLLTGATITAVQGIATLLETRTVVLVTDQNQVLDVLSAFQQEQLRQRIDWEISRYGQYEQLQRASHWALASLSPLVQQCRKRLPMQAMRSFAAKVQRSPAFLAGAQFRQFVESNFPGLIPANLNHHTLVTGVSDRFRLTAASLLPTTDTPLYQALCTAQHLASPALPLPPAFPAHFIRGIASLLETKTLVLVTNQNATLNILTLDQQHRLHQKIAWETAHYGRYRHRHSEVHQVMAGLHPTRENRYLLSPTGLFRQLMAWVQRGPLAIATNLFQEASLPLPSTMPEALPVSSQFALPVLLFQRLLTPLRQPMVALPPLSDSSQAGKHSGAIAPPLSTSPTVSLATETLPLLVSTTAGTTVPLSTVQTTWEWDCIDTEATPVGYVPSLLETVLQWLDTAFLWIERQTLNVWRQLQQEQWLMHLWNLIHSDEWRINLANRIRTYIAKFF